MHLATCHEMHSCKHPVYRVVQTWNMNLSQMDVHFLTSMNSGNRFLIHYRQTKLNG